MSFSRSQRNDRRRRVIRESIATDSDFAVESARAQRKARRASFEERSESFHTGYRDPGYSQAVRKTCQQRLTQLIPIRPGSLALALSVMWTAWGLLLLAHYFFHVRGNQSGQSSILLLQLFDVRSPHSIANWMTCQLWMMTAIVAWMIYRIRQHKLDDYRAKYRIWVVLAGIAMFSSFDTATSALYLLGQSIDGWTRKEIGYGGWPLVLACYASLVALMGVRLSSELKGTATAVISWFAGLTAWACAALLGTGLLKIDWNAGTVDMTVGACWLGGVLLVFQAAGMYLRHCYLQAQKRFVERAIASPGKLRLALPSIPKMPWSRSNPQTANRRNHLATDDDENDAESDDGILDSIPKKAWLSWRRSAVDMDEKDTRKSEAKTKASKSSEPPKEPKRPMRLFGLIPSREESNERLADAPISEDDGGPIDTGLTKKPGWFGIGGHQSKEPKTRSASVPAPKTISKPEPVPKESRQKTQGDTKSDSTPAKRRWIPSFGRKKPAVAAGEAPSPKPSVPPNKKLEPTSTKKSWLPFRTRTQSSADKPKAVDIKPPQNKPGVSVDSKATKRVASKIFGWLDGLKLKPPVDNAPVVRSTASTPNISGSGPKPITSSSAPFPSTSSKSSGVPAASSAVDRDDEDDGSSDNRYLSKAERKRLRRQQGNDRYAA